jgi:short-subunit dehydrogenase
MCHLQIMHTNLNGVINGLNTYVPSFQSRSSGEASAIVITGSKQGITNPPGNPAYNASKAAVKALAEHLSYDLKGTNVDVHLLVPGWTFTGLVRLLSPHCRPKLIQQYSLAMFLARRSRSQMVHGLVRRLQITW